MRASYGAKARQGRRPPGAWLADLVWPPRSLLSERVVERPGVIEPDLWLGLAFLSDPVCARCGFPLPQDEGPDALCGPCAADPPAYDRARAALVYDDVSARLVLDMKRGGRRDGLALYADWLAAAAAVELAEADLIVPAPMHWTRLASRTFNQAAWLAQALARAAGKQWTPGALVRVKRRRSQEGLNAAERRRNVAGAIRAKPRLVDGRAILVVDDVLTTGATAEASARALRKAGARLVHVATLARVVRPIDVLI